MTSIASMDLETSVNYLQGVLRHPTSVKPEVYHVIKRIHTLMEENVDGASDAAYQLHTIARGIIMYQSSDIIMNVVSCPNMATLLFSDEVDLLSMCKAKICQAAFFREVWEWKAIGGMGRR